MHTRWKYYILRDTEQKHGPIRRWSFGLPVYTYRGFESEKETLKHAFLTAVQANVIMSSEPTGCRSDPTLNMKKN